MKCSKCESEMEAGVVASGPANPVWGIKNKPILGLPNGLNSRREAITYRCKNCGYCETYAK